MEPTMFNPAQMQLLEMMSFVKSEKVLADLKQVISDYFASKAQAEIDRLWDEGEITLDTIEQWGKEHMRTPYK